MLVVTMFLALLGIWWGMESGSGTEEDNEKEEQQGWGRARRWILGLAGRARRANMIGVDGLRVEGVTLYLVADA